MFRRASSRLNVFFKHLTLARMSTQIEEDVLFQRINNTGVIILNRPKALNALNLSMVRRIFPQLVSWESDPSISLVIIKGAGDKAFCAGGDIRAVTEAAKVGNRLSQDFFKEEYILNHKIGTYKKPYVALINGITMGGGVGLSVHGRFRITSEKTVFAMPETAIGLFPDVGGGHFLPRLEGKLGIFLSLTGFRLKGKDVYNVGVGTHFVETQFIPQLEEALTSPMESVADKDVETILNDFQKKTTLDASKEFVLKPHLQLINELFDGHTMEEIYHNLEKNGSEWALSQLATLKKMSPTSMKITLRLLLEGKDKTLAEDLNTEYRLSQRCMEDRDFHEGVRAVLVDRDNSPQWAPASIFDVPDSTVHRYFFPLPPEKELVIE